MSSASPFTLATFRMSMRASSSKTYLSSLLRPHSAKPFRAGNLNTMFWSWYGQPHELATDLMRRSIIALESYVVGALRITALNAGVWSDPLRAETNESLSLEQGRGTADAYYNKVPALLSADSV
jgi:hypothetical protein